MSRLDIEIALAEGFRTVLNKPAILLPSFISSILFSYLFYQYLKINPKGSVSPEEAVILLKLTLAVVLVAIYFDSVVIRFAYSGSLESFVFALRRYPDVLMATVIYALAVVLGSMALIIPGIYLAVRLYYFADAILIDGEGAISSLKTSWRIAKGNWWATFLILIIIGLFSTLINALISSALSIATFGKHVEIGVFVQTPITAVFRAWSYSAFVNAYLQLKNGQMTLQNFNLIE